MLRGSSSVLDLPAGPWRAIFPWCGTLTVTRDGADLTLAEGEGARLGRAACRVEAPATPCYFLWEIHGAPLPSSPEGAEPIASYDMQRLPGETAETAGEAVLRFERVDLHPGVETPRHTHRGSGLRVLISGRLDAELDGVRQALRPGDAWLEKGPGEAVIGRAAAEGQTAFVRLLVLPSDCAGADSFVTLDEADFERPRPAAYRRFFEERVTL